MPRICVSWRLPEYPLRRETSGTISFDDHADWRAWAPALPISLSLPLRGDPVTALFEYLLPDSDALRGHVAEKGGAPGTDADSMLVGDRPTSRSRSGGERHRGLE